MVCADYVDASVGHGAEQFAAVGIGFKCRVAFCQPVGTFHRFFRKVKIVWAGFCGYAFPREVARFEQCQLVGRGDVHHMKACAGFTSQGYGMCGGVKACLA